MVYLCAHANTLALTTQHFICSPFFRHYSSRYSFNELLNPDKEENLKRGSKLFRCYSKAVFTLKIVFGIRLWWYPLSRTPNTHQPLTPIRQPYLSHRILFGCAARKAEMNGANEFVSLSMKTTIKLAACRLQQSAECRYRTCSIIRKPFRWGDKMAKSALACMQRGRRNWNRNAQIVIIIMMAANHINFDERHPIRNEWPFVRNFLILLEFICSSNMRMFMLKAVTRHKCSVWINSKRWRCRISFYMPQTY